MAGVSVRRALCALFVAVIAVVGAAGLSSLQAEGFCDDHMPARASGWSPELALWPPGWRCVYGGLPGGGTAHAESGSVPLFLGVLASELLIAGLVVRRWPGVPPPLRVAAVVALAFAVAGSGGLLGGFLFAILFGWTFGVPLAFLADRTLRLATKGRVAWHAGLLGALAAAVALLVAACLWLFGLGLVAFGLVLAGATLVRALVPSRSILPADG